ncbi:hypothetical protein [Pseudomonas monsensis]|uniref:hypothetical protein n=1 Tax=Pseudomonas monsensis TaxID=2745509 RepID=UPI002ABCCCC9|nr:hypothetical protein [Pseudomonas monsensis]MDZ3826350.1 hypothetical protein [Pseudomonas monsensis]
MGKISKITIEGFDIGMSLPNDCPYEIEDITQKNGKIGLQIRDKASLMDFIGLPPDTPPVVLADALRMLSSRNNASTDEKKRLLKKSNLGAFLDRADKATSVMEKIINVASNPNVTEFIARLPL